MTEESKPIWVPDPQVANRSQLAAFTRLVERDYGIELPSYQDVWRWTVEHLEQFWDLVWRYGHVVGERGDGPALADAVMPGATWFPGARLNYVDQVFTGRRPDAIAVVEASEDDPTKEVTWAQLERATADLAATLRDLGVRPGDRVAGYLPHASATIVAFLATASIGAVWSVCAPDYAAHAAANRMGQLEPVVLICADGYRFGGTRYDRRPEAVELAGLLSSVRHVVHVPHLGLPTPDYGVPTTGWADATTGRDEVLSSLAVPFDHPLWVLFSSGTTGIPKGLVHGHGGVVLEYQKILRLHLDLDEGDRMFWYTTPNWMMWNFVVSCLSVGACVLAYDGSPAYPDVSRSWRLCADNEVTVFGTSPGYLQACERAHDVTAGLDLSRLRLICATGAPVATSSFTWVAEHFPQVPLTSVSGGTDIVTGLAGGAPTVPVWPGELSCPALGVALDSYDEDGHPVRGRVGELVITAPMPTMPLHLWNDPDGIRYHDSYYDRWPGVWRHGDWVTLTDHGSVVIHGRSDATLNRKGVRLGSSDIYEIVESVPGVKEALVIGLDLPDAGYWMPLFVVLEQGRELDADLVATITARLRHDASPRHVPDDVIAVPAIPHTRTGKKLEVPVKRILGGARREDVLSLGAVDDPSALDPFVELGRARKG